MGGRDGWVTAVRGRTVPLNVTGPKLLLSADTDMPASEHQGQGYVLPAGGVVLTPVAGADAAAVASISCALTGKNVTEQPVASESCDLTALVGKEVAFSIDITGGAMLYTIGFGK